MKFDWRRLILVCLLGLLIAPAWSLADPETRVTKLIQEQVLSYQPEWRELRIEVGFKHADKAFEELKAMSDGAAVRIINVYQDFKPVGNVIFPLQATDGKQSRKLFIRAKVEVHKPVVVAARRIKRGETIGEGDVALEERDIALLPTGHFEAKERVVGTESRTVIPEKGTIFQWMIKEVPAVRRGEEVMIFVVGDNLEIKAPGIALMDGYLDQSIKVRRKDARDPKASLEGKLVSPHEVEVVL